LLVESTTRALLVEDNPGDTRLIVEMLAEIESDVELECCTTLASAIERLAGNSIEVVVLDLSLPDSQGIDTFVRLQEAAPRVAVIVLTGNSDTREALRTVEEGAQDFLVKGRVDGEILARSIDYARSRKESELQLRASQTKLRESNVQLTEMVYEVAEAMGRVVEARDPYTQGHQERVARVAKSIAEEMGLPREEIDGVEMAGLVHDIGKMCVPAEILSRPGTLSPVEMNLIRQHPQSSYDILKGIAFPWPVAEIALQHQERMDGSGYPRGLKGVDTLLASRILAVADVVEAMSSHRPYRPALGLDLAIQELTKHPGLYDPLVTASCKRLYEAGKLDL
jgi:putative nucleotidyltransferase with HDIG domain